MTFVKKRKLTYFGLIFLVIAITTALALVFLSVYEKTHLSYAADLQKLNKTEQNALSTQYFFKRQVQEWKNILLRGGNEKDLEKYALLFAQEFENTQNAAEKLYYSISENSEVKGLAKTFLTSHREILSEYYKALALFQDNSYDPSVGDRAVRGIDRNPTMMLDKITQVLGREILSEKELLKEKLNAYSFAFGSAFILIQVLFCWILVRLTGKLLKANLLDKATELGNRELFINSLKDLVKRKASASIIIVDINNFKLINEAFGNEGGDNYLKLLGQLLKESIDNSETICRIGSDTFGLILFSSSKKYLIKRVHYLKRLIGTFEYKQNDITLSLTANAGAYCMQSEREPNVDNLLNKLYASLQESKSLGPDNITFYSPENNRILKRQEEMRNVASIKRALAENRILLFKQLIKPINDEQQSNYFEILFRIQSSDGKILPPALFLKAAERFHLMVDIDKYMISTLIDYLAKHPEDQYRYSVNLAGSTLSNLNFIKFIDEVFKHPNLNHAQLGFEITESDVIKNFEVASQLLDKLRSYGCHISLDDFGTGMSSYAYISKIQVDTIKIDGSFIRGIDEKLGNQAIVRSIAALARDLGISTVAEFVENERELTVLQTLKIDYGQGYLRHKPEVLS
ncbi:EAL domain-containing protein [Agaribacter flavus]|uniref:EAL domain-containing protein n=1 Tax=Agaribacter flavus TaxID=1902781 RepID=A0ABV7FPF9_9ALTE